MPSPPTPSARRPYTRYTMRQVSYLRAHYAHTARPVLAARLGITLPQLYELARRHGLRSRAANGQVSW